MADEIKYGLSPEGFKRKRLPEIIDSLVQRTNDRLGISVQSGANSIFGQLYGIIGYELADIWEQTENVYYAMYPNTAAGTSLTNSASLTAIQPIIAEASVILCNCKGLPNTVILANSQIQQKDTNIVYTSGEENVYISSQKALEAELTINTVNIGTTYTIQIDNYKYNYTAVTGDNVTTVFNNLSGQIQGFNKSIKDGVLIIKSIDETTFSIQTSKILIKAIITPIEFTCLTAGKMEIPINTVTNIVTPINGWEGVTNTKTLSIGRNDETDTELRQRWSLSVYQKASNMLEAIQANVFRRVTGVVACVAYENNTDIVDIYGRLPHSIEVIVDGGDEQDIAEMIFRYTCGGIDFNGTISKEVTDVANVKHIVKFNRPTEVKIWLKLSITKNVEESWDSNGIARLKQLIVDFGNEHTIGQDVILQKFIALIYDNITGVGFVEIQAAKGNTVGIYSNKNIVINATEKPIFDLDRIEILTTE
nr:MAG TPA: Baseplate wedge protein [Caudoviricetes sp.]